MQAVPLAMHRDSIVTSGLCKMAVERLSYLHCPSRTERSLPDVRGHYIDRSVAIEVSGRDRKRPMPTA